MYILVLCYYLFYFSKLFNIIQEYIDNSAYVLHVAYMKFPKINSPEINLMYFNFFIQHLIFICDLVWIDYCLMWNSDFSIWASTSKIYTFHNCKKMSVKHIPLRQLLNKGQQAIVREFDGVYLMLNCVCWCDSIRETVGELIYQQKTSVYVSAAVHLPERIHVTLVKARVKEQHSSSVALPPYFILPWCFFRDQFIQIYGYS